jgi:lysozyme
MAHPSNHVLELAHFAGHLIGVSSPAGEPDPRALQDHTRPVRRSLAIHAAQQFTFEHTLQAHTQVRVIAKPPPKQLPARRRSVSAKGIHAIEHFEYWVNHPYDDDPKHLNKSNATIGYGHLLHPGAVTQADRAKWGTISRARGEKLLRGDLAVAVAGVKSLVKVPLTQAQFDALVSFTFHEGVNGLRISDALKDLNHKHYDRVAADFLHFDKHNHGVQNRLRAEGAMFAHGIYPH